MKEDPHIYWSFRVKRRPDGSILLQLGNGASNVLNQSHAVVLAHMLFQVASGQADNLVTLDGITVDA